MQPRQILANPFALLGAGVSVGLQLAAVMVPVLARLLHLTPLGAFDWVVVVSLAAIPAVVGQMIRLGSGRHFRANRPAHFQ